LSKNFTSSGDRTKWTWSGWAKRSSVNNTTNQVFHTELNVSAYTQIGWAGDNFQINISYSGTSGAYIRAAAESRDPSAWAHYMAVYDSANATSTDRMILYINGVRVTNFSISAFPNQNALSPINSNTTHYIGTRKNVNQYFDGYLADVYFIDGQALDQYSFGEFDDNGVWQPIEYAGTYGTNGFYLPFSDNSSDSALGTDDSGNGNDWTVNNINAGSPAFSNTIASSQTWSNYLTPSSSWDPGRDNTDAFDSSLSTFAYVNNSSSSSYINFNFSSGISGHGGFVWLYGGNGNGQGLDNMTVTINGSTTSSIDRTGTSWNNWFKYPVSGSLTSFRITGPYPVLNAISFWEDYSTIVIDSQAITYGGPAVIGDSLRDSPTNGDTANDTGAGGEVPGNYATWNPLNAAGTLSNGNLDGTTSTSGSRSLATTLAASGGKFYAEVTASTVAVGSYGANLSIGVSLSTFPTTSSDRNYSFSDGVTYYADGTKYVDGSNSSYGSSYASGDIIGIAIDFDNDQVTFYKNGTSQGAISKTLSGAYVISVTEGDSSQQSTVVLNAGQRAFANTNVPTGYKALCTANLDTPTIEDGSTAMDVALYTGNGTSQTISGLNLSPDLVWTKSRSVGGSGRAADVVRGSTESLALNNTAAETTRSTSITSFTADGFTLGSDTLFNNAGTTYAAWAWDAGASTVSNTDGSITSSVRANPTAGFSIVEFGSSSGTQSIGHGLGVAPSMIICRKKDQTYNWIVHHKDIALDYYLQLNTTAAIANYAFFGSTAPTSSVFQWIDCTNTQIAYCFAPVKGYSAFGSYTGNGSTDGPFIYTGFRPRWLIIKRSEGGTGVWGMLDTARNTYNLADLVLRTNAGNGESTLAGYEIDILSNGFKLRATATNTNALSSSYIYGAFAENPFKYARAR
jgi:hypothetical protein